MDYRTTTAAYVSMASDLYAMIESAQACPKQFHELKRAFDYYINNIWGVDVYKIKNVYADVVAENLKNNPHVGRDIFKMLSYENA